ncbi:MAG: hypothetical protein SGI73_19055 [Chloroflexota bacterium]|nr:hypothetical protein [Chloroflexota bacterium]
MDERYLALQTARDDVAISEMLDALIEIAESEMNGGALEHAADILALAIHYPLRPDARHHAEALFADLEIILCPRAIWDAREKALTMTLDELIESVLARGE